MLYELASLKDIFPFLSNRPKAMFRALAQPYGMFACGVCLVGAQTHVLLLKGCSETSRQQAKNIDEPKRVKKPRKMAPGHCNVLINTR